MNHGGPPRRGRRRRDVALGVGGARASAARGGVRRSRGPRRCGAWSSRRLTRGVVGTRSGRGAAGRASGVVGTGAARGAVGGAWGRPAGGRGSAVAVGGVAGRGVVGVAPPGTVAAGGTGVARGSVETSASSGPAGRRAGPAGRGGSQAARRSGRAQRRWTSRAGAATERRRPCPPGEASRSTTTTIAAAAAAAATSAPVPRRDGIRVHTPPGPPGVRGQQLILEQVDEVGHGAFLRWARRAARPRDTRWRAASGEICCAAAISS